MRSSRSPNLVAPVGQISAQAVCLPAAMRPGHIMHLRTRGFSDCHSYLGWANTQATMQYRQPMHFQTSYTTGPSLDRKSTRLNSSHLGISYAVFCLKKKLNENQPTLFSPTFYIVTDLRGPVRRD